MYFVWTFVFGGPVDLTDTQRKLLGVQENGWLSLSNALLTVYSSLMIDIFISFNPSVTSLSLSLTLSRLSVCLFPSLPLLLSMYLCHNLGTYFFIKTTTVIEIFPPVQSQRRNGVPRSYCQSCFSLEACILVGIRSVATAGTKWGSVIWRRRVTYCMLVCTAFVCLLRLNSLTSSDLGRPSWA